MSVPHVLLRLLLESQAHGYDLRRKLGAFSAFYDVRSAEDGAQAWSLLQQHDFDVIVADRQMPKMDGLELVRRVRASDELARLPVVLLTGMDAPRDREGGLAAGAAEYIIKGHAGALRELLCSVDRLTGRGRAPRCT